MIAIIDGRAAFLCDKCANKVTGGEAVVLAYDDLKSVNIVCEDCAEALTVRYGDQVSTRPAVQFFKQIFGRSL